MKENSVLSEANRCLNCANPRCVAGCPLGNNIPKFITEIKEGNVNEAYKTLLETSIISEICGRVCPQYSQCSGNCILGIKGRPVDIGMLEQYVADSMHKDDMYLNHMDELNEKINAVTDSKNKLKKIAVIGSGPAGISCAYYLVKKGYTVTIFEKENVFGGVLSYGIPEYRLPNDVVQKIMYKLLKLGVEIKFKVDFGTNITVDTLVKEEYNAIFVGVGATKAKTLNLEGETLKNIYTSNDFLYQISKKDNNYVDDTFNDMKNKIVTIVGGGNVALDCAGAAYRLGAKLVRVMYRRTETEMLVNKREYDEAIDLGIQFNYLTLPVRFLGKDSVEKIECVKMELGEMDSTGRRKPIMMIDSNYEEKTDYVITCVGSKVDDNVISHIKGIEINEDSHEIIVKTNGQTNVEYIFAGGDVATGPKTVAIAGASGTDAAKGIDEYLSNIK